MCEPNHSINQLPDDPDLSPKIESAFEKITTWAKKIGSWFHFSKMGMGHSESIRFNRIHGRTIPEPTRYEVSWWNRGFHLDGEFYFDGKYWDRYEIPLHPRVKAEYEDAEDSAKIYADQVSIGSLSAFRRFFETSVEKSNRPQAYFEPFIYQMLNMRGREILQEKIKRVFGPTSGISTATYEPRLLKPVTSMCLGLTRRRELLVPEWADDKKLWLPS